MVKLMSICNRAEHCRMVREMIEQSIKMIDHFNQEGEFLNQTITIIEDIFEQGVLIESLYNETKYYNESVKYLKRTKLNAERLKVGIEISIKDLVQLKNILEVKQQLSDEELIMLKKSFRANTDAILLALENYRTLYYDAISKVPFVESSDLPPFS